MLVVEVVVVLVGGGRERNVSNPRWRALKNLWLL
jgi:hypothetical protein